MSDNKKQIIGLGVEVAVAVLVVIIFIGSFCSTIKAFKKTDKDAPPISTEQTTEEIIVEKDEYVVKFIYNDSVFATQNVPKGGKVTKPSFKPAPTGEWDYNFDKKIDSDIEIVWK